MSGKPLLLSSKLPVEHDPGCSSSGPCMALLQAGQTVAAACWEWGYSSNALLPPMSACMHTSMAPTCCPAALLRSYSPLEQQLP
jgi:hypothetical protein